ncbi:MAG: V-type ATP synthase subunit D [Candidatus Hodarchaeota archaeon]
MKPTKTNLISLKKKLIFAKKGESFLEFKREQLITQIKDNWNLYQEKLKNFIKSYQKNLILINDAYKEMGKRDFVLISNLSKIQYNPTINIKYIKNIGITSHNLEYDLNRMGKLPAYSFENTSHFIDELMPSLENLFKILIDFAEFEDFFFQLALNFKKINRRINGLKNLIIPSLLKDIKKVKEILEELDRENFVRLKKTKELINKKEIKQLGGLI